MFSYLINKKLDKLTKVPEEWSQCDFQPIQFLSLKNAKEFFKIFLKGSSKFKCFYEIYFMSLFSLNKNGLVCWECWMGYKSMTVYFEPIEGNIQIVMNEIKNSCATFKNFYDKIFIIKNTKI